MNVNVLREVGTVSLFINTFPTTDVGGTLESLGTLLERLRRAELGRFYAIVYISWIPFLSVSLIVYSMTNNPVLIAPITLLGLIPYLWALRTLKGKIVGKGRGRASLIVIVIGFILSTLCFNRSQAFSVALFISSYLIAVGISYNNKVDVIAGISLSLLTLTLSILIDQWIAFISSITLVYSTTALVYLIRGVYEVLPYVKAKEGEER